MLVLEEGEQFPIFTRGIDGAEFYDLEESHGEIRVTQGTALVMQSIEDLSRIENVALKLCSSDDYETFYFELLKNWDRHEPLGPELIHVREAYFERIQENPDNVGPVRSLFVAINAMRELWENASDTRNFQVVLSLHTPEAARTNFDRGGSLTQLEFSEWVPVLAIDQGSLTALFLKAIIRKAASWGLTMLGVTASQFKTARDASEWFVEQARSAALQSGGFDFPRLDDLQTLPTDERASLQSADTVIVLLHGLFSTDVGTFDDLWNKWVIDVVSTSRRFPATNKVAKDSVYWVSWPHDTMRPITRNADDLGRLIHKELGDQSSELLFVCHSRGGLVARETIQDLNKRAEWDKRILGCLTFGTPHNGAQLARSAMRFIGNYVLSTLGSKHVRALESIFVYTHHMKRIDGIDDLAPPGNPVSDFIETLDDKETSGCRPTLTAIGGDLTLAPPSGSRLGRAVNTLVRKSAGWAAGSPHHDRVVPVDSSIPDWANDSEIVGVSHFNYFNGNVGGCVDVGMRALRRLINL